MTQQPDAYRAAAAALIALAATLSEAREVRFEAPMRERVEGPSPSNRLVDVADPTHDVVADSWRWMLSGQVAATETLLVAIAREVGQRHVELRSALSAWRGEATPTLAVAA